MLKLFFMCGCSAKMIGNKYEVRKAYKRCTD